MNKSKGELIAIRVSEEERGILEEKAKEQCMSVSQYIRYKSLLEEELNEKAINDSYAIEYLNKNVKMITRAIIETWINVKELSSRSFQEEGTKIFTN